MLEFGSLEIPDAVIQAATSFAISVFDPKDDY